WVYARRNDIGSPDIARRRTTPAPEVIQGLHVAESARARPSRDLRVINVDTGRRESAVPRNVRLKPTAGDTVPELRNDPTTTIPNAVLHRHRPDTRYEERGTNASTNQGGNASRNSGSSKEATADERAADRAGG